MESDYKIFVPPEHTEKFSELRKRFNINYVYDCPSENLLILQKPHIEVLHHEPETRIGTLSRPLIFPHQIFQYCQSLWASNRQHKFTFSGLITASRRKIIEDWIKNRHLEAIEPLKIFDGQKKRGKISSRIQKLFLGASRRDVVLQSEDILFWSSENGRKFPLKSWDNQYFKLLANSEFTLCPDGDFVWTYRFFESAICGAIPIIQNYTSVYEGFRFKMMEETTRDMVWSKEDAEHNFQLCQERLTIPLNLMNDELGKLLAKV
ncbi:exostosin family protein [Leptolyngbya sp. FACHB-16]|uniref:exostosin domain-containing protein n=1 Tax=unclassified Leptolyngbya TaxID=2650499 RepID=UPI001688FDF1|nr:exostosin family protein [Leptolyngbya sp. FACHB-16]MBD2156177.1 exostosin family protein [Leptolyngbya sp. FACHB-16]